MIESILMRATNQIDSRELLVLAAVAGNVSAAMADTLFAFPQSFKNEFRPRLRAIFEKLLALQTEQIAAAFIEMSEAHQQAIVQGLTQTFPSLPVKYKPITESERDSLFAFEIEGKNYQGWITQACNDAGNSIIATLENSRPDMSVLSDIFSALSLSHQRCFTAFNAEFLRINQDQLVSGFMERTNGF